MVWRDHRVESERDAEEQCRQHEEVLEPLEHKQDRDANHDPGQRVGERPGLHDAFMAIVGDDARAAGAAA